ncbi:lipoprotein [Endozoicomonas sp. G2_2]|nr:lipoprotein [Endozoicomonas sp. G2_2]MBO9469911.1 lipoprotein [Endozoicomonas sp. G2_2]
MKAFPSALFLALFSVFVLAGCGQKGPLYLPGNAPESQTQGPFGLEDDQGDDQSSTPDNAADDEDGNAQ